MKEKILENIKIIALIAVILIGIIYNMITKANSFKDEDEFSTDNMNILVSTVPTDNTTEELPVQESKIKVYVTGEVMSPGVYELKADSRVEDAINIAGGLTENAVLKDVNLAYILEDATKIYIPNKKDTDIEVISNNMSRNAEDSKNSKVNINKANASELEKVPGIGPSTAQKIIIYRNENGKFSSIDDIKNISGIGAKKFESIKDYISV